MGWVVLDEVDRRKTIGWQLEQQAGETARLVKSARALLDEVSVFKVSEH